MKKFLSFILSLAMAISLIGCGAEEGPDVVVKSFCDAMKQYDVTAMLNCTVGGAEENQEDLSSSDEMPEEFEAYFAELMGTITYTIGEATVAENTATVPVDFTYADISPVMTAVLGEYITQAFALAFAGASDEDMDVLLVSIFNEKKNSIDAGTAEITVNFPCTKTDAEWKISEVPEGVATVLTCNIEAAFAGFDETEDSNDSSEEFSNMIDVPMGTEIALATIKVKVTDCVETTELTHEYYDPDVAQAGTKYVVYTVEIENTSTDTISFDAETFAITDSQGRHYEVYDDAFWYYDSFIPYNDYAPNIPQSGNLVYLVPEDCEGYHFIIGKSGTSDAYKFFG